MGQILASGLSSITGLLQNCINPPIPGPASYSVKLNLIPIVFANVGNQKFGMLDSNIKKFFFVCKVYLTQTRNFLTISKRDKESILNL